MEYKYNMDEAPKDGTHILLATYDDGVVIGFWYAGAEPPDDPWPPDWYHDTCGFPCRPYAWCRFETPPLPNEVK